MNDAVNKMPPFWIGRLLVAALLPGLSACILEHADSRPPAELEELLVRADPLHPDFEARLQAGKGLFECLLSIDLFLRPDIDARHVRAVFDSLSAQTTQAIADTLGKRKRSATAEEAACAFLRTLDVRGFVFGTAPDSRGAADPKLVSGALLHRRGCCASFSLLLMAYLDRIGTPSSIVCLPDHCFVRIPLADRSCDVEATDFESPLRENYVNSPELAGTDRGGHYGRSLDREETLWHYYVDRLWTWSRWRCTDEFALRALGKARGILGSSCQSIDAQEAHRYFQIAEGQEGTEGRRNLARRESYVRYQRLNRDHPAEPDYAAALSKLGTISLLAQEVWLDGIQPGLPGVAAK